LGFSPSKAIELCRLGFSPSKAIELVGWALAHRIADLQQLKAIKA